ncbi:DUF4262 domain-containing protein [Conexibacter sp. JD483]|uniref:DUF4262 domain-containing protein n=1 Tax=unclassified Conexibacter TaxID=2627773 RepID=UPI00272296FC|nr:MULTISPECIES: DUF4262 domain-containing protein [unclassified Conexibacter]MDO8185816.1 DUF4262 domain-containing protein [Conexibacter sp. CPCC 205706]MDO8198560.1 DUF4262 domain-containing protein [Conexibacter sp. CPCC 205762]MDR9367646.1 DUF4262 domain-containing protein [Conexibacter sp. JD483]
MADIRRHSDDEPDTDASAQEAAQQARTGIEQPLVPNLLTPEARRAVSVWLAETIADFKRAVRVGPAREELEELGIDRASWILAMYREILLYHALARRIELDQLSFNAAAEMRSLLAYQDRDDLVDAKVALDAALAAARPAVLSARIEAYRQRATHLLVEHGFYIQVVGGREGPQALPGFAYTVGLVENATHPELVLVGIPAESAGPLLSNLCAKILAGSHRLQAGETRSDLLQGDYAVAVTNCPQHLLALVSKDPDHPTDAVQLLLPDPAGRLPSDPDVDPAWKAAQSYPDHSK